jgi:hypothetical protein
MSNQENDTAKVNDILESHFFDLSLREKLETELVLLVKKYLWPIGIIATIVLGFFGYNYASLNAFIENNKTEIKKLQESLQESNRKYADLTGAANLIEKNINAQENYFTRTNDMGNKISEFLTGRLSTIEDDRKNVQATMQENRNLGNTIANNIQSSNVVLAEMNSLRGELQKRSEKLLSLEEELKSVASTTYLFIKKGKREMNAPARSEDDLYRPREVVLPFTDNKLRVVFYDSREDFRSGIEEAYIDVYLDDKKLNMPKGISEAVPLPIPGTVFYLEAPMVYFSYTTWPWSRTPDFIIMKVYSKKTYQ